ncbi:MAG: VanZ family protein, partial [Rhodoferax sp.]|nr:VanZ family protein [Rhodoferax sp.]
MKMHLIFWKRSFWFLWVLTLCLSLMPANQIPSQLHFWDKAQHSLGFITLGFVGLLAYPGRTQSVLSGLVLFGCFIELAQWLTGWRFGDWQDWLADCLGLAVAYASWYFLIVK